MEALVVIVGVVAALWMQSGNAERCCSDIAHVVPASKETVRVSPSKDVATRQFRRMDGRSKIDSDKGNAVPARIADSSRVFMQEVLDGVPKDDAARLASEKNQVMDALLDQPQIPADYGSTMIALYRDRSQDVVTRDFAVQHIGHYALALNRRGQYAADSAEARELRAALFDAASETHSIVAAAAFRALADVSEFDSSIDARRLDSLLVACAADAAAEPAPRAMAIHLCGERRISSARQTLAAIIADPGSPEVLRRSAQFSLSRVE